MQRTKRNFRINVVLIISAVIIFTILAVCCYLDYESNYLIGNKFSYNTYQSNKYKLENNIYQDKEGTIIAITNYKEYTKVLKHYNIEVSNKLTKQDFKDTNYLYLIIGESSCIDDIKYEYYVINNNEVNVYLSTNNCACPLSSISTYAYEIPYIENIAQDTTFNINFLNNQENQTICEV